MIPAEGEIKKLIAKGNSVLNYSEHEKVTHVRGINKFRKKVKKELLFLDRVLTKSNPINACLNCSNLHHLEALICHAINEVDTVSILHVFKYSSSEGEQKKKLTVDVVSQGGSRWNKISARNARALTRNSIQDCNFGVRSVLNQAEDYLQCAREHPYLFQTPEIVFNFTSGIEASLSDDLKALGIKIRGEILDDGSRLLTVPEPVSSERNELNALNLDVTTMMAYVSSSTNGGSYAKINSAILSKQLKNEQNNHVKEMLDTLFEGKKLLCCRTALDSFKSILQIIAGAEEKKRGEEFLIRMTVVPDYPSEKSLLLKISGKIKQRSIIIFGTGDALKVPTVTANAGFVRAAEHQGIKFVVFTHESRALTEVKEIKCK